MNGFGERLRKLRGEMKQTDAAQMLGINYSTYAMYEVDRREPNFETLIKIASHYGVSTDYLLGLTECQSPDIDVQAICKKTGLWNESVKRLIANRNSDRTAIVGSDPEGLCDDDEVPQWMHDAYSVCVNCFILDDNSPFLASKAYHVAEEMKKAKDMEMDLLDEARKAVEKIDSDLWVLSPYESQVFYRYRVETYSRKIASFIIDGMRILLKEDEYNGEA